MVVQTTEHFEKQLKKISPANKKKINRFISQCEKATKLQDLTQVKKIVNEENLYRWRFGDYRLFFENTGDTLILILYYSARGDAF